MTHWRFLLSSRILFVHKTFCYISPFSFFFICLLSSFLHEKIISGSGSDYLMQSFIDKANYETERSKSTDRKIGMSSPTCLWLREQRRPNQIFTTSRNFSFSILTGENVSALSFYYCSQRRSLSFEISYRTLSMTKQESPAWTQEAYRPPHGKY